MDFPWRPEADKKCGGVWGGESPPHEEANVPEEANVSQIYLKLKKKTFKGDI